MCVHPAGRRIEISGTVQGVGLRPWIYRLAHDLGLSGSVRNHPAGVTVEAFGSSSTLDRFVELIGSTAPPAASIRKLDSRSIPPTGANDFFIAESVRGGDPRVSIPPDLATCAACVAEIFETGNRRYRYPFTNCTDCGPRFTIAQAVPYDRPATTMARFTLCGDCQREYDDPGDRRFHAQPNACPVCGPRLRAVGPDGIELTLDPIHAAAAALRAGRIVAIKGLGGFHLACDARSSRAVNELRRRKRRIEKPFAVMVRDLAAASSLARLDEAEQRLLTSVQRPIVLVARREGADLAAEIAPRLKLLGLMLPYSPLHHLITAEVGGPLVMTSGNLSDEPIAFRDDDALARLGGIADLFLVHDREIETRCDDSIARVIASAPVVLRRSRGYVPRTIALARPVARPVLACGAHLKNTFCIASGDSATLGPHLGDLDGIETFRSLAESVLRMERFLRVRPEVIAHDLHPGYLSTVYARERPETTKIPVQHHHAHVASAMAEHGLDGPVIGVAFDGTGLGDDGALWGGEFLVATYAGYQRVATLRPIALAGGEAAIREVWRLALALVDDAFDGAAPIDELALFRGQPRSHIALVRKMIAGGLNAPLSHGVGRLFDAVGALALERALSRHEGQVALEWNLAAEARLHPPLGFAIDRSRAPWQLDLREMVRGLVGEILAGVPAAALSAIFHDTLAKATAEVVRQIARQHGALPVVLSGGCFQNARLAEGVLRELSGSCTVHLHREVPPGDGGLALGQALVANAVAAR